MNTINILIAYDDLDWNYTRHCCVTILSILENNKKNKIKFYIISSCLSKENVDYIKNLVDEYNQDIEFIIRDTVIPKNIQSLLINRGILTWWTFYRLFFNLYIKDVERILYLDCDTIITKDLSYIYNMDMQWKPIAWYYDSEMNRHEREVLDTDHYINAWVLLIDAKEYIKYPITIEKIKQANKKYEKRLNYADQDYLNILFRDEILISERWMNYLITRPFLNSGINKATIIHCLYKPYLKYSFCPKKVKKLYYHYLNKTKWKWYPEKVNWNLTNYIVENLHKLLILIILKIFGVKWVFYYDNLRLKERVLWLFGIRR